MAYSNLSQLHMLNERFEATNFWGVRAYTLAEQLDATEIMVHALTNIGTVAVQTSGLSARATLERALAMALQHDLHDHAGRAYANLISEAVREHDYKLAAGYLNAGLSYMEARDLDLYGVYLRGWQARYHFEQGVWDEAEELAAEVLRRNGGGSVIPIPALIVLGHLRVRRGEEGWQSFLDTARELALPTEELQRIGPLSVARAEAAWWQGDAARCIEEARVGYELAVTGNDRWVLGAIAYWLWRAGGLEDIPGGLPEAYKLMFDGHWREAAQEWERTGCPYEQALALAQGDQEANLEALQIFERLGAVPAARDLKRKMRATGVKGIPAWPSAHHAHRPARPYGARARGARAH